MVFKFKKHAIHKGKRYLIGDEIQLSKSEAERLAERGFGEIIPEDNTTPKDDATAAPKATSEKVAETEAERSRKAASGK